MTKESKVYFGFNIADISSLGFTEDDVDVILELLSNGISLSAESSIIVVNSIS